jgi:RHS repeat-associated protein
MKLFSITNNDARAALLTVAQGDQPRRLEFAYDYLGRRVEKKVYDYNPAAAGTANQWVLQTNTRYLYQGWNLIAELEAVWNTSTSTYDLNISRTYHYGLAIAGTLAQTGGVGALLMIQDGEDQYFPAYDGNGNVTGLLNAEGETAAAYEYTPYGELLRCEGGYARQNPFRFSTKYWDEETGLVYYGLRYYSPGSGKFINRDPIGEAGGLNLYGFVGNNPVNRVDVLGMADADEQAYINDHDLLELQSRYSQLVVDPETGDVYLSYPTGLYHNSYGDLTNSGWSSAKVGNVHEDQNPSAPTGGGETPGFDPDEIVEMEPFEVKARREKDPFANTEIALSSISSPLGISNNADTSWLNEKVERCKQLRVQVEETKQEYNGLEAMQKEKFETMMNADEVFFEDEGKYALTHTTDVLGFLPGAGGVVAGFLATGVAMTGDQKSELLISTSSLGTAWAALEISKSVIANSASSILAPATYGYHFIEYAGKSMENRQARYSARGSYNGAFNNAESAHKKYLAAMDRFIALCSD